MYIQVRHSGEFLNYVSFCGLKLASPGLASLFRQCPEIAYNLLQPLFLIYVYTSAVLRRVLKLCVLLWVEVGQPWFSQPVQTMP